ncbi:Transmembrane domain-containing protein [Spironucleus salmonicida]|uniref:Transmembrane domain-containing protein n=1 Tax=Spironucleus salmonicida TaxID=348837 RepID=A0A9P8S0I9_9EUKA|nr:Transmembrane domain-containing protein [Spironucleus salmonicida]
MLALLAASTLASGSNYSGKLGLSLSPKVTSNVYAFAGLDTAFEHLALCRDRAFGLADGRVLAWGRNLFEGFTYFEAPKPLRQLDGIAAVNISCADHFLAVQTAAAVLVLGLFQGTNHTEVALEVPFGGPIAQILASNKTVYLLSEGSVFTTENGEFAPLKVPFPVTKLTIFDGVLALYSGMVVYVAKRGRYVRQQAECLQFTNASTYLDAAGALFYDTLQVDSGVASYALTADGVLYLKGGDLYALGRSAAGELGFQGVAELRRHMAYSVGAVFAFGDYAFVTGVQPASGFRMPVWGYIALGGVGCTALLVGLVLLIVWLKKTGRISRYPILEEKAHLISVDRLTDAECTTREVSATY